MNSRIKLRRTQKALSAVSDVLLEGEALYSFQDNQMIIGDGSTRVNEFSNRIYSIRKELPNKFLASSSNTSDAETFPIFRQISTADLPSGIPASKISDLSSTYKTVNSLKNRGSVDQPIYFDSNGNAQVSHSFVNYKSIGSLKNKGTPNRPVYFDSEGNAIPIDYVIQSSVPANAVFTDNNTTYSFTNGNGSFTVTPSVGSPITVSIGKPSTATTADKAIQLSTSRQLRVNLSSTESYQLFDGSQNALQIPVSGTLPLNKGGTGRNTNWYDNGIVYKTAGNEYLSSTRAPSANQVLATDQNAVPTWKTSNQIIDLIDWQNISSWKNTYIWETLTLNNTPGTPWTSQSQWIREYGSNNKYTHGISGNTIHLLRGTLDTEILNKNNYFYYTGTGSANLRLDLFSNFGYIPRSIIVFSDSRVSGSGLGTYVRSFMIDLFNLYQGSTNAPWSATADLFQPAGEGAINTGATNMKISWVNNTCKSIIIPLDDRADATAKMSVVNFNLEGSMYCCMACEPIYGGIA